jgi:hypothetical protein
MARRLQESIEAVTFIDAQKVRESAGLGRQPTLLNLDPGMLSADTYSNPILQFSFHVPPGWRVLEGTDREKRLEYCCRAYSQAMPGHEQGIGNAPEPRHENEMLSQCSRILLWMTKDLPGSRNGEPSPVVGVIAFNSGCFPGLSFPKSSKDREDLNDIVRTMFPAFAFPWDRVSIHEAKAFPVNGHLLLQTLLSVTINWQGRAPIHQHNLILTSDLGKYWVVWLLIDYNVAGEEELPKLHKQLQIQFF